MFYFSNIPCIKYFDLFLMLETLFVTGGFVAETAGGSIIPHVLTVKIGEVMQDS